MCSPAATFEHVPRLLSGGTLVRISMTGLNIRIPNKIHVRRPGTEDCDPLCEPISALSVPISETRCVSGDSAGVSGQINASGDRQELNRRKE